jgi:VacB/RNase II family 3'-5' exoribonuclease
MAATVLRMRHLESIARRVMQERGLEPDFSKEALKEAESLREADARGSAGVRDLRKLLWSSIDNDTSRDLDQLSVAEALPGGGVKILVAIADVDALVKRHTAIDAHAQTNTTSVYTAAGIFPMLPERLSTDLTSLGPGEDRLAVVIELTVDETGVVTGSDIFRAAVHNHAKLTYNATAAWLDGSAPPPPALAAVPGLDEQIRTQDHAARNMRALRFQHGALTLRTPQAEAVFDGDALADMRPSEANRAKELIEDLMVAANGVTARYLGKKGIPSLRRLLRSPERWSRIREIAEAAGGALPAEPSGEALAKFLAERRAHDPGRFADLSLSVVKLLGRGEYAVELPGQKSEGHFGLAVSDYTHSTAPNRRFPDLITQRLIKAALAGEPSPYRLEEMHALARHCTLQETNAEKVQRRVDKSAAAMLLTDRIGEEFQSVVTGASPKGTWVRISHPVTEGKVVQGFRGLDVGDRLRVKLLHADIERGLIDFARAH